MAESKLVQLNIENSSPVYIQYAMPWLHCDIRSCCRKSLHAFTSRYYSTFLDCIIFTPNVFLHEIDSFKTTATSYIIKQNFKLVFTNSKNSHSYALMILK